MTKPIIECDIETRATLSVTDVGLYRHAPTADVLLMWYRIDGGEWTEWRGYFADGETPESRDAPPQDFINAVNAGGIVYASNAAYERVVLSLGKVAKEWGIKIEIDQTACVLAWARAFNLPGNLDGLTNFLLPKDESKSKLSNAAKMLWNANYGWPKDAADLMDEQSDYCLRDCTSQAAVLELMPPMDPNWLHVYHVNERINDRGAFIDRELAELVVTLQPAVEAGMLRELTQLTDGAVTKTRGPSMKNWLLEILPADLVPHLTIDKKVKDGYGWKTKKIQSAGKKARAALYEALDTYEGDFDPTRMVQALHVYEEANKAAVRKFKAAIDKADYDLLQGQFVQNGASATGRYASYGVQVHNLKRDVHKDVEGIIDLIRQVVKAAPEDGVTEAQVAELEQTTGMTVNALVSGILRPMFVPEEDKEMWWCDWSAIEARVLPWLSDKQSARDGVLRIFETGGDVYKHQAGKIFNKKPEDVDPDFERQAGKVAVLALGFQGGPNAYLAMAGNYGLKVTHAKANEIKVGWRDANPWAVEWWYELENAAMNAIEAPNTLVPCGRIQFQYIPDLFFGTLLGWLPDGSWVAWPDAAVVDIEKFDGEVIEPAVVFQDPTYGPSSTYGGDMAQTFTQATAARLLWRTLVECDKENVPVVLHVHDEVIVDGTEEDARILEEIMNEVPDWAKGLPMAADVEHGPRYKVKA